MSTAPASTETTATPVEPSEFNVFFSRAYPAAAGLALRVLDRHRQVPDQSLARAEELATEALARARVRRLRDTPASVARVMAWTADLCLPHLAGHPGHVPLPPGIGPADLLPEDLLRDGAGEELLRGGLPLDELQAALMGLPRRSRRVGLVCLGAGLPVEETAALLGVEPADVARRIERIAVRLADRRRVGAVASAPAPEAAG